jgi:hypothetical protein
MVTWYKEKQFTSFGVNDCMFRRLFLVYRLPTNVDTLIGMDFLVQSGAEGD